ncbi:hypothetical protein D3C87_339880 [compost metagenome]
MANKYTFRKYQPLGLRIWHWLNALAIFALLGTVLLRKTFLSWRSNAALIQNRIQEAGGSVSTEVAANIAKELRDLMWEWHVYIGFALGALLIYRLGVGLWTERKCPGVSALKSAFAFKKAAPEDKNAALHETFVKTGYALFYLVALFMVVSGVLMYFEETLSLSKGFKGLLKETHELLMWFFIIFITGHVIGVVVAENRNDKGLVSDMIHGGDLEK